MVGKVIDLDLFKEFYQDPDHFSSPKFKLKDFQTLDRDPIDGSYIQRLIYEVNVNLLSKMFDIHDRE